MAKKPGTIGESSLKDVIELKEAAGAAKKAASEAHDKDVEAEQAYEAKINDLRIRIATGAYTTGDHLLDINIVVNSSVAKDERYELMAQFEEALVAHAGELVGQSNNSARTPHIEKVGLLPESPRLTFRVGGAFGLGRVYGGDASVGVVIPVVGQKGLPVQDLTPLASRTEAGLTFGNIIFEDKLQWILENEPNMHLAVGLWSKAQILGRPLKAPERVAHEITLRRESCAIELNDLVQKHNVALRTLRTAQQDPRTWQQSQMVMDEDQRMIVSFPREISALERVQGEMRTALRKAVDLGMNIEPASESYVRVAEFIEAIDRNSALAPQ